MASDQDRIKELQLEVERLMSEVDKYRTATEDALQQLDWCVGYFTGCNKASIAKSLGANRAYIRRHLLNRQEAGMPASPS
jgi:DNA-binding transcriptional regulator LsrR (DeoR family)